MLTELRADNYKAFRLPAALPLRQITILLGKNNSGKTAAARLPLLVLSAIGLEYRTPGTPIPLRARGLVYGSSTLELAYGRLPHSPFSLGVTMRPFGSEPINVNFSIQQRQSLKLGQSAFVSAFDARPYISPIAWDRNTQQASDKIFYDDDDLLRFEGVLPILSDARKDSVDLVRRVAGDQLKRTVHLKSIRTPIQAVYENRPVADYTDPGGGEVPYILNADQDLLLSVADWYQQSLGIAGLDIDANGSSFSLSLRLDHETGPNVARVGQGVQQVLPVATYLTAMEKGLLDLSLFIAEEPELHLHPAAHGSVADLAVAAIRRDPKNQVVIETHSENLVLRLRRRVAEGDLRPDQVSLLWFEHVDDKGSFAREIKIREDGSVDYWPRGVFAEDYAEVQGIFRAAQS